MKLTIYKGANCPKCPAAKQVYTEVAEKTSIEFIDKLMEDNMIEALQHQIASTPSIMIDEEVVFRSEPPTKEELLEEVKKRQ